MSTASVIGLFEEKEESLGVVSAVLKVQGEDHADSGSLRGGSPLRLALSRDRARWHVGAPFRGYVLLGPPLRKLRDRNDSPILINQNCDKATHSHSPSPINYCHF